MQIIHDPDAGDETIVLAIEASGGRFSIAPGDQPRQRVTLDDDETQSYVLALRRLARLYLHVLAGSLTRRSGLRR